MALPSPVTPTRRSPKFSLAPSRKELCFFISFLLLIIIVFQLDWSLKYTSGDGKSSQIGLRLNLGGSSSKDHHEYVEEDDELDDFDAAPGQKEHAQDGSGKHTEPKESVSNTRFMLSSSEMRQSSIIAHAPGWTILDNIFMLNGTIYIVTTRARDFPHIRMMFSSGYPIFNGRVEVAKREPTYKDMQIIGPREALKLFGDTVTRVKGVSFLVNDPPQFITHYYHFAAELFFGLWRTYASLDPDITVTGKTRLPPPRRLIFTHTPSDKWRDYARMNQWIFHSAFPSAGLEFEEDWKDRADTGRVYMFDRIILADRAAAMRGRSFTATDRYASEAVTLNASPYWWAPIRSNVVEFSGLNKEIGAGTRNKPVITYVSRQNWGRRMLKPEDHESLVKALRNLEKTKGYEINIVEMEKMTREEQLILAGRTTILMGVHGNGLTSLLWMNPTPRATVIEFFYPGGFAFDYEWTARAIGLTHYGFWGNSHFTAPNLPPKAYPEGFQGNEIPLNGELVAALCVKRLSLEEELDD